MKYHFVVKANESIFPRSPRKNSDSRFGIKNINYKSSHPVCRSVKVSSKNRHEQQQIVKKTCYSSQAATERVQKLRVEYWEKIKDIGPENKRIFG